MTFKQFLLTVLTVLLLSAGQILFKHAAGKMDIESKGIVEGILFNYALLVALVVYGVATISWIFVLLSAPLSVVYPFAALAFIMVPIFSFIFLGEDLKWTTFAGAAVIMAGVYVTQL